MIVNPWSVSALAVDALSSGLAMATIWQAVSWFRENRRGRFAPDGQALTRRENDIYLLFWMGSVLLGVRFLAWPLFYLVLHSFVPEIEGAMCIFGTRNMMPVLTRFLEGLKPFLFYMGLIWLMLFWLERFATRHERAGGGTRRVSALLLLCAFLALVDGIGSMVLWMRSSVELTVSCCTTVTDIPTRFTVWMPVSLFGPEYEQPLWYLFYMSSALAVVTAVLACWKTGKSGSSWALYLAVFVSWSVHLVLTVIAYIEVIAPRLMHLPFHHCLYCMAQKVLDAPFFLGLFIIGTCAALAVLPVWLLARFWSQRQPLERGLRFLLGTAAFSLTGSVFMISLHLLIG